MEKEGKWGNIIPHPAAINRIPFTAPLLSPKRISLSISFKP
jgi:hypothetical protein